jgi:hypothetical protein
VTDRHASQDTHQSLRVLACQLGHLGKAIGQGIELSFAEAVSESLVGTQGLKDAIWVD